VLAPEQAQVAVPTLVRCARATCVAPLVGPPVLFLTDALGEHAEREVVRGACVGPRRESPEIVLDWDKARLRLGRSGPRGFRDLGKQVVERLVRACRALCRRVRRMTGAG
jgi:hypothetical protein